jgi:hypothetical protein
LQVLPLQSEQKVGEAVGQGVAVEVELREVWGLISVAALVEVVVSALLRV